MRLLPALLHEEALSRVVDDEPFEIWESALLRSPLSREDAVA